LGRDVPVVQNEHFLAQLRQDGTTFVLVNKPAAGVWTLTDDGASPVKLVREARGLPDPSISAAVRGRGRSRVLSWKARRIPGQSVTFAEIGKDVRNAITTTKTVSGSVRFRPAAGPAGKRRIVALVQQNGLPRTTLTAGSYRAPGMLRPGRPGALKAKRKRSSLVVSWRPRPAGFRHAVYFRLSDGRRIVKVVAAKRRRLVLKRVPRRVSARVKVQGLGNANGKGPAALVRVKRPRRGRS
jgi:hypothetical protein